MAIPKEFDPADDSRVRPEQEDMLDVLECDDVAKQLYLGERRRATLHKWDEEPGEVRRAYRRRAVRLMQARLYYGDYAQRCVLPPPPEAGQ